MYLFFYYGNNQIISSWKHKTLLFLNWCYISLLNKNVHTSVETSASKACYYWCTNYLKVLLLLQILGANQIVIKHHLIVPSSNHNKFTIKWPINQLFYWWEDCSFSSGMRSRGLGGRWLWNFCYIKICWVFSSCIDSLIYWSFKKATRLKIDEK